MRLPRAGNWLRGVWPGLVGGVAADATSLLLQSERGTVVLPEIATDATSSTLQPRDFSFLLATAQAQVRSEHAIAAITRSRS